MDKLKKFLCCLLGAMLSVQLSTTAFATPVFRDVSESSPWYDAVNFAYKKGITIGVGDNCFDPDSPITVQQWAIMLCRALSDIHDEHSGKKCVAECYSNGWISVNALLEPNNNYCRGALYESAFGVFGIDTYSYELYPNGTVLSPWNNCLRIGKELGLCASDVLVQELVTRGEAVNLLYQLMTKELHVTEPPVLDEIHINNKAGVALDLYLLEINEVPETVLKKFQQLGWQISIDGEYLRNMSEERGLSCIGATSYRERTIYLIEAGATHHEIGHFYHGVLGFPDKVRQLYELEAEAASDVLGSYAVTDSLEYFAEYFTYWLRYCDNTLKMDKLEEVSPETFQYFAQLAANNFAV